MVVKRSVSFIQIKGSSNLELQKAHFEKVYGNALGKNGFFIRMDSLSSNILIIHWLKELDVDVIMTDRVTTRATQAMRETKFH